VGALLLPALVSGSTFFIRFAIIGITGLLAGLIALGGPKTTGLSLEKLRQRRYRRSARPV
jgi:MFS transporter, putative metabolite:H+ symporter